MESLRFVFSGAGGEGISVPDGKLYDGDGFGFLTEKNIVNTPRLQIPELNSGFTPDSRLQGAVLTVGGPVSPGRRCGGLVPLTFAADVPEEGGYRVDIEAALSAETDELFVFLGRRRLVCRLDRAQISGAHGSLQDRAGSGAAVVSAAEGDGFIFRGSFITNICPIIPRGYTDAMDDLSVDVTLLGEGVRLLSVCISRHSGRTLYIAGDSTVADQSADYPYLPHRSYCGWGQMLPCFLKGQLAVSNHAHSGLTTESFRSEGHYRILLDRVRPGDICLFQFAHNDQKLMNLKADGGYRKNLLRYINEIRQRRALPVLVTPLARNSWRGDDGKYNDLLARYDDECIKIGSETGVPVLRLHELSMRFILEHGRDAAKSWFFPSDYTHSNDYGAYLFASFVYYELVRTGLCAREDYREWEPAPRQPELELPPGIIRKAPPHEKLFDGLERPEELLTRAEAFEFVEKTMRFFPTNVYNDMFTDVIGHETYAGIIECAWQNGLIPGSMTGGGKICPEKAVTGGEFIEILMRGYRSRRAAPENAETNIMAAAALNIIPADFPLSEEISRRAAADICEGIEV